MVCIIRLMVHRGLKVTSQLNISVRFIVQTEYGLRGEIVSDYIIQSMEKHGLKVTLRTEPSIQYTTPMAYGLRVIVNKTAYIIQLMGKHGLKVT